MPPDDVVTPPTPVRAAFALFIGDVVLSLLNAVIQLSTHLSGAPVLIGALIESALFIGLGSQMRVGKLWARVALMSVAWVFVAFGVLALLALNGAFGHQMDALVIFALVCVVLKLFLILSATFLMYRPETQGYFR